MKNLIHTMLTVALVFSMVSVALARGAPTEQTVVTSQSIASVEVAPVVASVPPLTVGYDVIQNITEDFAIEEIDAVTTDSPGLSTTGDERGISVNYTARGGSSPDLVLLA